MLSFNQTLSFIYTIFFNSYQIVHSLVLFNSIKVFGDTICNNGTIQNISLLLCVVMLNIDLQERFLKRGLLDGNPQI